MIKPPTPGPGWSYSENKGVHQTRIFTELLAILGELYLTLNLELKNDITDMVTFLINLFALILFIILSIF